MQKITFLVLILRTQIILEILLKYQTNKKTVFNKKFKNKIYFFQCLHHLHHLHHHQLNSLNKKKKKDKILKNLMK